MPLSPEPLSDFARHARAFEEYLRHLKPADLSAEDRQALRVLYDELKTIVEERS